MNTFVLKFKRSPEFLSAARYLAQRNLKGKIGDALPMNMEETTVKET